MSRASEMSFCLLKAVQSACIFLEALLRGSRSLLCAFKGLLDLSEEVFISRRCILTLVRSTLGGPILCKEAAVPRAAKSNIGDNSVPYYVTIVTVACR
jgi:hypothetical protein